VSGPTDDDAAFGGDVAQDSGVPGDALFYCEPVTKTVTSGQTAGAFTGLVSVTDPEASADTSTWKFPLDPDLNLLTGTDVPDAVVYQVFTVNQVIPNAEPTLTANTPANVQSGTTTSVTITAANDADGDTITIDLDWDNDGTFEDTGRTIAPPYTVPVTFNRPGAPPANNYNNATLTPATRDIPMRYTDGVMASPAAYTPTLQFTLGANRPPTIGGAPAFATNPITTGGSFTLNAGTATATDPEGDPVTYRATANVAPMGPFGTGPMPITGIGPYASAGTVQVTLWARDTLHQNLVTAQPDSASNFAALTGTVNAGAYFTANFNSATGQNIWIEGEDAAANGAGSNLLNSGTNFGTPYGAFRTAGATGSLLTAYCTTALPAGAPIAGGYLNSSGDQDAPNGCAIGFGGYLGDYAFDAGQEVNCISSAFSTAGASSANLIFDAHRYMRSSGVSEIYWSNNNGAAWTLINTMPATATNTNTFNTNYTIVVPAGLLGSAQSRIRFRFRDPVTGAVSSGSQVVGWNIDNVRVQ
ncbi:MAG TPA: hypothetical protein VEI97_02790, partial [bacterium]|nr:hypothetical protein [bacterium]